MEKLTQADEGGGAGPPPFNISTITYKVVVYAPAERAGKPLLFLLYPYMTLWLEPSDSFVLLSLLKA
jgi:hypothetical protein